MTAQALVPSPDSPIKKLSLILSAPKSVSVQSSAESPLVDFMDDQESLSAQITAILFLNHTYPHDDQRPWIQLRALPPLATVLLGKSGCLSISFVGQGFYNVVYQLVFSDNSTVAARVLLSARMGLLRRLDNPNLPQCNSFVILACIPAYQCRKCTRTIHPSIIPWVHLTC